MDDAVERGVLDRAEVDVAVERWRAAEDALNDAASSPVPERDEKMNTAMPEYNDSTAEVTRLYLKAAR